MSKLDNLTDFLTDIADTIRTKKGTSGAIDPQDFSSEISSIGGGGLETIIGTMNLSSANTVTFAGVPQMPKSIILQSHWYDLYNGTYCGCYCVEYATGSWQYISTFKRSNTFSYSSSTITLTYNSTTQTLTMKPDAVNDMSFTGEYHYALAF